MRSLRRIVLAGVFGAAGVVVWGQGPGSTEAPSGERVALTLQGEGVQIYTCQLSGGGAAWVFDAPEAKLVDGTGATVGSHGAGPVWRLKDGSSVIGEVLGRAPGTSPADVPSLLLKVKSHAGSGTLTSVEYVRRTEGKGGAAPVTGCDVARAGTMARVPYVARYTFYTSR